MGIIEQKIQQKDVTPKEIQKKPGRAPDFKSTGGGWAAWVNKDKNGDQYLSLQGEGFTKINLWEYKPKEK